MTRSPARGRTCASPGICCRSRRLCAGLSRSEGQRQQQEPGLEESLGLRTTEDVSGQEVLHGACPGGPIPAPPRRSAASHTFAVPSSLAVASRVPSGDQDTELTTPVCPLRVSSSRPLAASHTFAVPS